MNRKTQTQVDLDLKEQKEFWETMLSRMARASGLKPDYERNYGEPPLGGEFRIELTGDLYLRLRKLSKGGSFLLYTTLMAGLNVCLYKHTGNPTVLVCSPTRKRPDVAVLQTALLPIVNEVPDRQSFQDQLVSVRQTLRDVYARQHYPLEQLVGEKGLENVLSQRPLVNLVLSLKDIHNDPDDLWDAVSFTFNEEADRITGRVRFNRRLFRIDTIIRFTDHYVRALTEATAHLVAPVGDLSVMSEAEQFLLTVDWNDTCSELRPDLLVHGLIEEQARRAPDSIAVVFEDASLSYNELNRRANQLARRLRRRKIGPDATVAISLARSPELVVAILGVMK
jgi:non-ribosomal peptide synthetase component F